MKKIYEIVYSVLTYFLLAKRSDYTLHVKLKVLLILNNLYIRSLFLKKTKEVTVKIFGYKITAYDYNIILFLFKEIFLSKEYYFKTQNKNPKIIDCGANIGMSILYFKFLYPNCSIIAFEPNPMAFLLLKKNIIQNNLIDVELKNVCLSDREESIEFFTGENLLTASNLRERGGESKLNIQAVRLSDYITDNIDLIKIDVEGAEFEILGDLISTKKINFSERYIIEYHHRMNSNKLLADFIKPFEEWNFGYSLKTSFSELGSFQDILFYFFKENILGNP